MPRRLVLTALLGAGILFPRAAAGNGRPNATVDVQFRRGDSQFLLVSATFGFLVSPDGGETLHWICEQAIGYGGNYDPDYAVTRDGRIFATTFQGLRKTSDGGCSWQLVAGALAGYWVADVEVAEDGRVWAATASGTMTNDLFVSSHGDAPFVATGLQEPQVIWTSVRVASDSRRVYASGFRPGSSPVDGGMIPAAALLRRSDDGGQTWIPLAVDSFPFAAEPQLSIAGVSPADGRVVYVRVVQSREPAVDALYRSVDAGITWRRVLQVQGALRAFALRRRAMLPDHIVAGTVADGVHLSTDGAESWSRQESPKMACVGERDGVLIACGSNDAPDFFALGRSSDAITWLPVFRFTDIDGPLFCPAGTPQADICARYVWPSVAAALGLDPADTGTERPTAPAQRGCGGCQVALLPALLLARCRRAPRRRRAEKRQRRGTH